MDQQQIFLVIAMYSSTVAAAGALYAVFFQRRQSRRFQLELFHQQDLIARDFRSRKADESQDSLMLELLGRISELSPDVYVTVNTAEGDARDSGLSKHSPGRREEVQSVVAEIAHSLNTPLSQIEAAVLVLADSFREGTPPDDLESQQSLNRILSSVEICKVFIGAYGELSKVAAKSKEWTSHSLSDAIRKAGTVYNSRVDQIKYSGPEEIPGYSNTFILAVILPLIENAVEATRGTSGDDNAIQVNVLIADGLLRLSVSNSLHGRLLEENIYDAGQSTKEGHSGLGLSAIRRLVTAYGGTLRHTVRDDEVTFYIELPEKSK